MPLALPHAGCAQPILRMVDHPSTHLRWSLPVGLRARAAVLLPSHDCSQSGLQLVPAQPSIPRRLPSSSSYIRLLWQPPPQKRPQLQMQHGQGTGSGSFSTLFCFHRLIVRPFAPAIPLKQVAASGRKPPLCQPFGRLNEDFSNIRTNGLLDLRSLFATIRNAEQFFGECCEKRNIINFLLFHAPNSRVRVWSPIRRTP